MEPLLNLPACCWPILALVGSVCGILFVRCAWCGKLIEAKGSEGGSRGLSQGGMCRDCAKENLGQWLTKGE